MLFLSIDYVNQLADVALVKLSSREAKFAIEWI